MTDLVTRLRALAEENIDAGRRISGCAIREAADRIQTLEWHLNDTTQGAKLIAAERDKAYNRLHLIGIVRDEAMAKLAEAEEERDQFAKAWQIEKKVSDGADERAEARAEAAALREALTFYADYASWTTLEFTHMGVGSTGPAYSDTGRKARKTISHPGPGAALLERVKKLEAVAEKAKLLFEVRRQWEIPEASGALDDMPREQLLAALAALEEKP